MTTTTPTLTPSTVSVLLDDLLLDAQHELESFECPELGQAVATARIALVRRSIEFHEPPIKVAGDSPDLVAPKLSHPAPDFVRAESIAQQFCYRMPWDEVPFDDQQRMMATALAVLHQLGDPFDPRTPPPDCV